MKVLLEILALLLFLRSQGVQCSDNAPSPTGAAHVGLIDLLQYTASEKNTENSTQHETQTTDDILSSSSQALEQNDEMKDLVRLKRTPHKKGLLKGLMGMMGHGGGGGCSTCGGGGGYAVSVPVYITVKKVPQQTCSNCYVPPPQPRPQPRPQPISYCDPCNRPPPPPPPPSCNTCGGGGGGSYAYASSTAYSGYGKKK